MSGFQRFGVYYLPDDRALAAFGASWLGWDVVAGRRCNQPAIDALTAATETPRRYGFHGTLKPPFRMAPGKRVDDLATDIDSFARRTPAFRVDSLELAAIGRFLALVPSGDTTGLQRLAFGCVAEFDSYRAPLSERELERRRAAALTARQETLLAQWGYPYVDDEFRFHLTLSGKLDDETRQRLADDCAAMMPPLETPFEIASVSLVGQGADGMFRQIHRYALTG